MRILIVLGLAAAGALGQVSGTVTGFDGRPLPGIIMNAVDAAGEFLHDVKTDRRGGYRFPRLETATHIIAYHEGVAAKRSMMGKHSGRLDFDLRKEPHFTLDGTVIGRDGNPLPGTQVWAQNDQDHYLGASTTDAKGRWRIRMNRDVAYVCADPRVLRVRRRGPFTDDATITLDYREEPFFLISGMVTDERGRATAGDEVSAWDARDRRVATFKSDALGRYRLWVNRPVHKLRIQAGPHWLSVNGPWKEAAAVDVDYRRCGLVLVTGRVLDEKGQPIVGAEVAAGDCRRYVRYLTLARTDAEGRFRALVRSGTDALSARVRRDIRGERAWSVIEGPIDRDRAVEFRRR